MCQDKWQKITPVCIFIVIGVLLFGARVSGQDNDNIPIISASLPTFEPPTLLQTPLDRPDSATVNVSFAPLTASAAVSRTRVITALADTLITQGYPTANCGDELNMRVGYDTYLDPDGETLYSLIRFNLASISTQATVHSATLWLYLSGSYDYPGHSVPITPYRISSPWAVDTVTWTSQPSYAESYTPTWVVHGNGVWYPFDVTDLVRHWAAGTYPNYGLVLLNPGASNEWRAFAASETIAPPHLIISYEQSSNFTLTMVPDTQTVVSGRNTSSSILYVTSTDGFSESTTLDIAGLPLNTSYTWSASPVTPTASTLLTITTTPSTPRGVYTLTITGTSARLVQTTTATLEVLQPDFEMNLQPALQSVWSGQDARYTTHLTATDGFTAGVALDIGGLPANTTYEWATNPVAPTTSTQLTITTAPDTPGGTYTFTITGTGNSLVHTAQAVLHVSEPDFQVNLTPPWGSVGFGDDVRYTTYITGVGGFSESVTLDVGGLPPSTTHEWSANPVIPTTSVWLTITTAPDTPGGTYTFTVTGTAGSLVHTAQATLYVSEPDFELTLSPSWQSVPSGESARCTAFLTATGGFSQNVTLDITGLPPDTTYEWSANSVTPTTSTQLTITTTPDTPSGTYTFTITGTAGSLVHAAQATLSILNPSFELSIVPSWISVGLEEDVVYTAYLTATDGFSESVALDVDGLPPNVTQQWSVNPITPTASALLTLTTMPDTPRGVYTLTITGTSVSSVRTAQATLQVSQPDFELSLRPFQQSIWSGEDAPYTAHLTATDGFTASVLLDIGGLPPSTTHEWSANPVTPTVSTLLTITTVPDTPGGTYTLMVTGTAGSLIHTAQAVMDVSEPDFELEIVPLWLSVGFGDSARYTAHLTATGGFSKIVTLDVGGVPSHTTHTWSINPVTPTTSASLTITTTQDTPSGTYTLTITGTAGSLFHVTRAALHVSEPDFELYLDPSLRSVVIGESTHYTAHLVALGSFMGSVTLDVDGVPSNTSSEWSSNPIEPTASTVLTIVTTQDTPTGTHSLTVTGTSAEIIHSASVSLTVRSETIFETVYLPLVLRGYPSGDVTYRPWHTTVGPHQTSPTAVQDTPVSRIALVIGVADYEHMEPTTNTRQEDKTHDLGSPDNDAFDLEGELCRDCDLGQVYAPLATSHCGDTSMTMLVDSQATKGAIHAAIINWMDPLEDENTIVMISFSGHGMYAPDDDGDENDPYDEFIVPHDIDIDEEGHWIPQTAISDDELASWLGELESQQIVVFIDSCFAGGMITDTTSIKGFSWNPAAQTDITAAQWRDSFLQDIQGAGRVVLAATTEEQASWEFGELQNGVFTYFLVEALHSTSADTNSNGWISAEEAYNYLDSRVDDYVWNHTSPPEHQNPQIGDGVSGEVDITQPVSCDSCPAW